MAFPATRVEIAWDSGFATAEGDRTWTDVSSYVEGSDEAKVDYGRADELSAADPNSLSVTFDNRDGRFTPGKATSPYYPNVKKGKPVRLSVRYSADGSGNFLSANQASFETSVADWSAGGTVPPTLAQSATHVDNGSQALRITWGTAGTTPRAETTIDDRVVSGGLIVGRTYTAQARVWVTSGTPDVFVGISGSTSGTATSTKSAFTTISVTFVATASSHILQVRPSTAPTSGQQCWVDSVMVDEGSSTGTFTTSAPPIYTRFTGYVNEWPVVWPESTDAVSQVTITASSRRARLGQTAPLTSAIRAAYLETGPDAYWPMDDDLINGAGQQVFRDITNTPILNRQAQSLASFYPDGPAPVINDGTPGPTDEASLVRFDPVTGPGLVGSFAHYVGGGNVVSAYTAGEVTLEAVARIAAGNIEGGSTTAVARLLSVDGTQQLLLTASGNNASDREVSATLVVYDSAGSLVSIDLSHDVGAVYDTAVDGRIHHYAATLSPNGGNVDLKCYLDGVQIGTTTTVVGTVPMSFTGITLGDNNYHSTSWIGHAAVTNRALTAAEILAHGNAATAAFETDSERVVRVAGRIGVPSDEIDVETSIAAELGPQSEAGRSAADVLDEVAKSTGGIAYDTRAGHLALQARNHRYNQAAAFTLSATAQEVGGDLTVKADDRYLINTVEFSRVTTDAVPSTVTDDASIDDYGIYSTSISVVSSSDQEVEAAAQDILYRYADGGATPRVSQVTLDLANLSDSQRRLVLAADIGTRFAIGSLASQAPSDPMSVFFEGCSESITATSHIMTVNTTPADVYQTAFTWDSATLGKWDSGNVWAY